VRVVIKLKFQIQGIRDKGLGFRFKG
jgi:hypothetical protein